MKRNVAIFVISACLAFGTIDLYSVHCRLREAERQIEFNRADTGWLEVHFFREIQSTRESNSNNSVLIYQLQNNVRGLWDEVRKDANQRSTP